MFDLLAMIENGFSSMYSVQKTQKNEESSEANIEAEIGTSNLFTFLSAKLSGKLAAKGSTADEENISEERIHTPASLFSKLIEYLGDEVKLISNKDDIEKIKTGDFVRFKGEIKENQMIKLFDSFSSMFSLANLFKQNGQGKGQVGDAKKISDQIRGLADSMRLAGIVDLICKTEEKYEIVLQSETKYFENQFIGIIEEGEYSVLGKVIKIPKDESDKINLMRNTSLSLAKESLISTLLQNMSTQEATLAGLAIGDVKTSINGILVIPIAIFA